VQVHPSDDQKEYIPKGDTGKTEAWFVIESGQKAKIYAGLTPGTTEDDLRKGLAEHKVADYIHSFTPKPNDGVFIHSGTVHTLADVVVFEVQENSDTTYRLDWDRTDEKTGKPRELQVDKALACIDFNLTNIDPVKPTDIVDGSVLREEYFNNEHFILWRMNTADQFTVGKGDEPRILICTEGKCELDFDGAKYPVKKGDVVLLPAEIGVINCIPQGKINLLEIGIPDNNK